MQLVRKEFKTPVGTMTAIASDKGLCFLEFGFAKRDVLLEGRLKNWFKGCEIVDGRNKHIDKTKEWLDKYFASDFKKLPDIDFDVRGSEFELRVWKVLNKIKLGQVLSYGEVAKKINKPKAARAIGGASRRNPVALITPCHRVIGSSGSLTGYGGGLPQKEWLLAHECFQG